ncbi:MAG: aspartate--tRNA(Asn) ligase [Chlamydiia bacterium]
MAQTDSRTLASELLHKSGQPVRLLGWLNTVRSMGKLCFLILRDRSGFAQITFEDRDLAKRLLTLQPGSVLEIEGIVREAPEAEMKVEVVQPTIRILSSVHDVPPVEYVKPKIPSDLDHILDHRAIALRNRELQAVFRIQGEIVHAYRLFMHDVVEAYEYFPPNLIGASSEGGSEFFNVDYFGYTATLAQSSQLYKQIMVGVNERVFALAPFFRAENSNTPRHLTEGKQLEFEMGFFRDWTEVMDVLEASLKSIVGYLQTRCQKELAILGNPLVQCPADVPFPRITFKEAQELYFQKSGVDDRAEPDLSPAAERVLCQWAREEHGTDLVFITDWLTVKRPFYSQPNAEHPEITNTFDLLCAGTEIVSGGERRHTYESMVEGILLKGMKPEQFTDYLSIFRYGMPPHGGFGLGLERLTMTLLHLPNIREASLFPSDPRRIASTRLRSHVVYGGEGMRNEILRLLKAQRADFKHLRHDPTPTATEATRMATELDLQSVKALILKGKNTKKNIMVCIPTQRKLDMKVVAEFAGEKCEFEDPKVIEERFGLIVGGVPPFGTLMSLDTFFDQSLLTHQNAVFNCGLTSESIICPMKTLVELVQPKTADFCREGD